MSGRSIGARYDSRVLLHRSLLALAAFGFVALRTLAAAEPDLADLKKVQEHCRTIAPKITAATVGIINPDLAGPNMIGHGSGVVVDEDGTVLTVGHVLSKEKGELIVVFADGRRVKAISMGSDRTRDAGMVKITEPGKWPHVEMGKSADLKPGQWCLAMGHPGGVQEDRTPPIRLGRILSTGRNGRMGNWIVTDAPVISGDSGGPLFDLDGKLIGINSNIGMMITQNQHVPVDVYHEEWAALLSGKQTGELPKGINRGGPGPIPGLSMEDVGRFRKLLNEHVAAKDPDVMGMMKDGHMQMDPAKMKDLLAKWDKQPGSETKPIDYLKFHRLFEDRLLAGDHEVLDMIKDGKMMLTPVQMHDLMDKWERKAEQQADEKAAADAGIDVEKFQRKFVERLLGGDPDVAARFRRGHVQLSAADMKEFLEKWEKAPKPAKTVDPADVDELLKNSEHTAAGKMELSISPDDMAKVFPLLRKLGMVGDDRETKFGKGGDAILAALKPPASGAATSMVIVQNGGKPVSLGTIVSKNGYILTKASELKEKEKLVCKIGKRELEAKIVKKSAAFDLALLKVDADDLEPIAWADGDAPRTGTLLVVPGAEGKPIALGILSIAARMIPKSPVILVRNSAALGVLFDNLADGEPKIDGLHPGGPAEKVGLKVGDLIVTVDGKAVSKSSEVRSALGKFKPGDKVTVGVKQGDKKVEKTIELGSAGRMSTPPGEIAAHKLDAISSRGGTISKRNNDFPVSVTHDAAIQADQCGGPVVDLDGHAIGLNIARADRTATYAIPASRVKSLVGEMMPK